MAENPPPRRRGKHLPKGYSEHDGGACPVEPDTIVDCIIRTTEGFGHSGARRADEHEWNEELHSDGIGAVVGWRLAGRGEEIDIMKRWQQKSGKTDAV